TATESFLLACKLEHTQKNQLDVDSVHAKQLTISNKQVSQLGNTLSPSCITTYNCTNEIFRVLRIIQNKEFPPKTHEILQELRDLSSMAMEHFDEKIAPNLKFRLPCAKFRAQLQLVTDSKQSLCEVSPITNDKLNRVIKVFQKHLRDAAIR
ncbi:unnamed protein product, partial [Timema podura]|nr:unnamed protein product [Timema podura]